MFANELFLDVIEAPAVILQENGGELWCESMISMRKICLIQKGTR
jgi:hypothetical protein